MYQWCLIFSPEPAAGIAVQSCPVSLWPLAARCAERCQGVQHLALVLRVVFQLCVTEVVLSTLCPHPFASAAAAGRGAAIGTLAAWHQSGLQEGCKESVEVVRPPETGSEPLHQVQEETLEKSHLVQVSKENPCSYSGKSFQKGQDLSPAAGWRAWHIL